MSQELNKTSNKNGLQVLVSIILFIFIFICILVAYRMWFMRNSIKCDVKITDSYKMEYDMSSGYQYTAVIYKFYEDDYNDVLKFFGLQGTKTELKGTPITFQSDKKHQVGDIITGHINKKYYFIETKDNK